MNKKQKALALTVFTALAIITTNRFIEGVRFQTVYYSRHAPEDTATERQVTGNTGAVEKSTGGEDSLTAESSPETLIKEVFGDKAEIAIAIAKAESQMNPEAVGDKHIEFERDGVTMGHSCGLFQVRVLPGRPDCETLKDPKKNIEYAKRIYDSRGDFTAWSAYTNGAYKKYL